jgi:tetratricopeptide (TPR) repeat protein
VVVPRQQTIEKGEHEMATLTQAIATYSYIDRPIVNLGTVDPGDTDIAVLVRIASLMSQAAASFSARQYNDAITTYHAAESLIYTNLDPTWQPEVGMKLWPMLPRDPSLFEPLLSSTSQWLNILPVPTPPSPVRPTSALVPTSVTTVANLSGAGLAPVSANANTAEALADLRLATIYTRQGNTVASTVATRRAESLNSAIVKQFNRKTSSKAQPARRDTLAKAPASAVAIAEPTVSIAADFAIETLPQLPISVLGQKQVGLLTGTDSAVKVSTIGWAGGSSPNVNQIIADIYVPHVQARVLPDVLNNISSLWERASVLPHDYFYVIPLALAQCYQALGDYATAESYYLQAASYTYINTAVEGPYVWTQLAGLYGTWGDSLYQQDELTSATTIYNKVLLWGSITAPASQLYTISGLSVAAGIATSLIPQLATLVANGTASVSSDDTAIASALLKIYVKLNQINAGLDFWGVFADTIPIWPFSYLQQVATNFTQYALDAEQEVINFWSQAQQALLTQTQLQNQVAQANAQVEVATQQLNVAVDQAAAYGAGVALANLRATDAAADASEYASKNSQAILAQAEAQQVSGGDDGDWQTLQQMVGQLMAGQTISGDTATVAAAGSLYANTFSQQYQVDSMNRTASEMSVAATEAAAQLTAANAQVSVAQGNLGLAALQAVGAAQTLAVFNAATFTPQVWLQMGNFMDAIYQRYMNMALQAAKLMQQAYNFENDTAVAYIKDSYPGLIDGLLAADTLMADIQSFTFDLITSKRGKKQLLKKSISLATNYAFQFQTQLKTAGSMTFETTLDDFDTAFPGTYQSRIKSISVDIQGIVPPAGISGSLTNGGISTFRLPSDIATPNSPSKIRIQDADTLVLSDYEPAVDGVLDSSTGNQLGIFEGAGVASTWTLSLPPALNDINYGTLTDVVMTVVFESRVDPQLVQPVLQTLASRPGFYDRERSIPLGWLYPDLFYGFKSSGTLTLNLAASDFPTNQTNPVITAMSLLVAMQPGTSASGITISLTPPGGAAMAGLTDGTGTISSQTAGSPWAGVAGRSALGGWTLTLTAAANPALAPGGALNLSSLLNLVLILDYSFTPRA